jgi:CheY-like chemotaxis protein
MATEPDDRRVADAGAPQASRRPRVLVVDDHEDSVEALAMLLERLGYEVRTALTGSDAIAHAQSFVPNAVVLDLGLPDMDGYAVLERMRGMPPLSACTFVALSGRGLAEDLARSREAGFHHHLVKPTRLEALQKVLPPAGD